MRILNFAIITLLSISCYQGQADKNIAAIGKGVEQAFNVLACTEDLFTKGEPLVEDAINADDWQEKLAVSIAISVPVAKAIACALYKLAKIQSADVADTAESDGYLVYKRANVCSSKDNQTDKPDGKCSRFQNRASWYLLFKMKARVPTGGA